MAAHVKATPLPSDRVDVPLRPAALRSFDYRRATPEIVRRIRSEFVEMRGFSPTVQQAARLFALTPEECAGVLGGLVQEGFLLCTTDGRYRLPA